MTFEDILEKTVAISQPESAKEHQIQWFDDDTSLGLAKDNVGGLALFVSAEVETDSAIIRRHLDYKKWRSVEGEFKATRLMLPRAPHFMSVGALIVCELLRAGFGTNRQTAFDQCAPIIQMALQGLVGDRSDALGLIAELMVLRAMVQGCDSDVCRVQALEAWKGEGPGPDFVLPHALVEVKATSRGTSRHHIQSLGQIDPPRDLTGAPAKSLHLVSCGLVPANDSELTVPRLVEEILLELGPSSDPAERRPLQASFLAKVRQYGRSGRGYEHDEMKSWRAYTTAFRLEFLRVYDTSDEAILSLRPADLDAFEVVRESSVSYEVELPSVVTETNPQTSLSFLLSHLGF